jgi:hypothetical protein
MDYVFLVIFIRRMKVQEIVKYQCKITKMKAMEFSTCSALYSLLNEEKVRQIP